MIIKNITLRQLSIPLRFQFSQANNAGTRQSLAALLEYQTAEGIIGYGEACPRLYVTGETMDSVRKDLQRLAPEIKGNSIDSVEDLQKQLSLWEQAGIGNSTLCTIEMAWLDAWSRSKNQPLLELLGGTAQGALSYSLILPLLSPQKMAGLFQVIKEIRPPKIKFKVDRDVPGAVAKVQLIREVYGPDIPIRIDVNGGWSLVEALENIPILMDAGIYSFEEPLSANRREDLGVLTKRFGAEARIMADESLLSLEQARQLLENGLCNHFNLKISKLGGIFKALAIYRLAAEYGVPCQMGAHFGETSLLTAAGVLLAALAGPMTACEGAMGEQLLEKDIVQPAIQHSWNGDLLYQQVLEKPGLGSMVEEAIVKRYSVSGTKF